MQLPRLTGTVFVVALCLDSGRSFGQQEQVQSLLLDEQDVEDAEEECFSVVGTDVELPFCNVDYPSSHMHRNFTWDDGVACGDCIRARPSHSGCEVAPLSECVCAADSSCCGTSGSWSDACVRHVFETCETSCLPWREASYRVERPVASLSTASNISSHHKHMEPVDMNNDSLIDLVVTFELDGDSFGDGAIYFVENLGGESNFAEPLLLATEFSDGYRKHVHVMDMNQDAYPDLVFWHRAKTPINGEEFNGFSVMLNPLASTGDDDMRTRYHQGETDLNRNTTWPLLYFRAPFASAHAEIWVEDLNGDGAPDVIGQEAVGNMFWRRNMNWRNGSIGFAEAELLLDSSHELILKGFRDLNADGRLDAYFSCDKVYLASLGSSLGTSIYISYQLENGAFTAIEVHGDDDSVVASEHGLSMLVKDLGSTESTTGHPEQKLDNLIDYTPFIFTHFENESDDRELMFVGGQRLSGIDGAFMWMRRNAEEEEEDAMFSFDSSPTQHVVGDVQFESNLFDVIGNGYLTQAPQPRIRALDLNGDGLFDITTGTGVHFQLDTTSDEHRFSELLNFRDLYNFLPPADSTDEEYKKSYEESFYFEEEVFTADMNNDGTLDIVYPATYDYFIIYTEYAPTPMPTSAPTPVPSSTPTLSPTATPTPSPTVPPTPSPTSPPTGSPTSSPSPSPTSSPTHLPTSSPSPSPTSSPTSPPTLLPSSQPTPAPTLIPTPSPSPAPTRPVLIVNPDSTPAPTLAPAVAHADVGGALFLGFAPSPLADNGTTLVTVAVMGFFVLILFVVSWVCESEAVRSIERREARRRGDHRRNSPSRSRCLPSTDMRRHATILLIGLAIVVHLFNVAFVIERLLVAAGGLDLVAALALGFAILPLFINAYLIYRILRLEVQRTHTKWWLREYTGSTMPVAVVAVFAPETLSLLISHTFGSLSRGDRFYAPLTANGVRNVYLLALASTFMQTAPLLGLQVAIAAGTGLTLTLLTALALALNSIAVMCGTTRCVVAFAHAVRHSTAKPNSGASSQSQPKAERARVSVEVRSSPQATMTRNSSAKTVVEVPSRASSPAPSQSRSVASNLNSPSVEMMPQHWKPKSKIKVSIPSNSASSIRGTPVPMSNPEDSVDSPIYAPSPMSINSRASFSMDARMKRDSDAAKHAKELGSVFGFKALGGLRGKLTTVTEGSAVGLYESLPSRPTTASPGAFSRPHTPGQMLTPDLDSFNTPVRASRDASPGGDLDHQIQVKPPNIHLNAPHIRSSGGALSPSQRIYSPSPQRPLPAKKHSLSLPHKMLTDSSTDLEGDAQSPFVEGTDSPYVRRPMRLVTDSSISSDTLYSPSGRCGTLGTDTENTTWSDASGLTTRNSAATVWSESSRSSVRRLPSRKWTDESTTSESYYSPHAASRGGRPYPQRVNTDDSDASAANFKFFRRHTRSPSLSNSEFRRDSIKSYQSSSSSFISRHLGQSDESSSEYARSPRSFSSRAPRPRFGSVVSMASVVSMDDRVRIPATPTAVPMLERTDTMNSANSSGSTRSSATVRSLSDSRHSTRTQKSVDVGSPTNRPPHLQRHTSTSSSSTKQERTRHSPVPKLSSLGSHNSSLGSRTNIQLLKSHHSHDTHRRRVTATSSTDDGHMSDSSMTSDSDSVNTAWSEASTRLVAP